MLAKVREHSPLPWGEGGGRSEPGEGLLAHVNPSDPPSPCNRPLTRPAPAGESAGSGTPSPQGRGQFSDQSAHFDHLLFPLFVSRACDAKFYTQIICFQFKPKPTIKIGTFTGPWTVGLRPRLFTVRRFAVRTCSWVRGKAPLVSNFQFPISIFQFHFLVAASAARVEPMVISRDSLGMLVTKGVISQPNPVGMSRVREIDSHST